MIPIRARIITLTFFCLWPLAVTQAQVYDLSWSSFDGGGITIASGGGYELSCTVGQGDAADAPLTGGGFTVEGGFVPGANPPCPGDLDGNGRIDLTDLASLLAHFGVQSGATLGDGDIDADGDVDLTDLSRLLAVFGTNCS